MTSQEQDLIKKFKELSRWMYQDAKEALFPFQNNSSGATFVVATALFNFIEICGLFLIGPRRPTGEETTTQERFNAFFDSLGPQYKSLRVSFENQKTVYDEIRCGMTHEGLIKNRDFCILGLRRRNDDNTLRSQLIPGHILSGQEKYKPANCGIIFNNNAWIVVVGKLLIDFQDAVQRFILEIEDGTGNRDNFFKAANHINLQRFKIEGI